MLLCPLLICYYVLKTCYYVFKAKKLQICLEDTKKVRTFAAVQRNEGLLNGVSHSYFY